MVTSVPASQTLKGRVVVVTGASSGVGLAVGRRCAAAGAKVVMLARDLARLRESANAARTLAPSDENVLPVSTDVRDRESVRAAVDVAMNKFGVIDTVFNVAGTARIRRLDEATEEEVRLVIETNYLGPLHVIQEVLPGMRSAGTGDIVNVSSEITLDHLPLMSLYASSKAALESLTRQLVHEVREFGIRVTLVVLGTVEGTGFGNNFSAADIDRAKPLWDRSGYARRVSGEGPPMAPDSVAEVLEFAVTRPVGLMLDVLHVRAI
jgi:NAD(P)-dependent dehydrogenase (short-subunit alcohol dehydrogenase family)